MVQAASPGGAKSPDSNAPVSSDVYTQDGDYIRDIEINDLRNRYTLTKGATQKMVNTSVTVLLILPGMRAGSAMRSAVSFPLFLCLSYFKELKLTHSAPAVHKTLLHLLTSPV